MIGLIAAVARNGVIGREGELPWHLPDDLRLFKRLTMGSALVMGRRTYDSIGRPLPGRTTVVVTRQPDWDPGWAEVMVAGSLEAALDAARERRTDVFVAGGADVYRQALPLADALFITEVDAEPEGDTFFPQVDREEWREVARADHDGYSFVEYRRR